MSFKFWDASEGVEIVFEPVYTISSVNEDPDFPTNAGFGVGIAAFRTLNSGNPANMLPQDYALGQNYPNPFNPTTTIKFDLPEASMVKLEIYNILGQKVITLQDQICSAGYKSVRWDGRSESGFEVATGLYIYRIQIEGLSTGTNFQKVKKMMMLK